MASILVGAGLSAAAASAVTSVAVSVGLGLLYQALTPPVNIEQEGSRLESTRISASTEGAVMPRTRGWVRMGGQMIWATRFREEFVTYTTTVGGGKGGGSKKQTITVSEYLYYCSFAVAFCEGSECTRFAQLWADGKPLDLSEVTHRFYSGTETQGIDPLIDTIEGPGTAPAFRGVTYIVFEDMLLKDYGNRIPQINAEIVRPIRETTYGVDRMEDALKSIQLIPSSGEQIYGTRVYTQDATANGESVSINQHAASDKADIVVSLDTLDNDCLGINSMSLVVSWFGSSTNAGRCRIEPKSERTTGLVSPEEWRVGPNVRSNSEVVSYIGGPQTNWTITGPLTTLSFRVTTPGYNKVPNPIFPFNDLNYFELTAGTDFTDGESLADAINLQFELGYTKCNARWYPDFDTLELNDYSEEGNMSISFLNSDVNAVVFSFDPEDLKGSPVYGGAPADVTVREAMQNIKSRGWRALFYPFILMDMARFPWRGRIESDSVADTNSFVGTVTPANFSLSGNTVNYTGPADEWSQRRMILHYATLLSDIMQPGDAIVVGTEMRGMSQSANGWGQGMADLINDVKSILAPGVLVSYASDWSEYKEPELAACWGAADFIGIDNYLPLTDWRDGDEVYTIEEFQSGVEGGEYWDYFYASDADREANIRSPITQPQFRQKDIRYWQSQNYPTTDVWFTEFGAPAVDKGANQPNVFVDQKSIESFLPYFSNGQRNDLVQKLYYEATLDYWKNVAPSPYFNPDNMFAWTWDARPYPAFPSLVDVWSDGPNWETGHWLNGRLDQIILPDLVQNLCLEAGIPQENIDVTGLLNAIVIVRGMYVSSLSNTRQILENLMETFMFDAVEDGDKLRFVTRGDHNVVSVSTDDFVLTNDAQTFEKTRISDQELPDRTKISFLDESRAYAVGAVDGHTRTGQSRRVNQFTTICVIDQSYAKGVADAMTQQAWIARDSVKFSLPVSYISLKPGDMFTAALPDSRAAVFKIIEINFGEQMDLEAVAVDPSIYELVTHSYFTPNYEASEVFGPTLALFPEVPLFINDAPQSNWSPRIVAYQSPWPRNVDVYEDDLLGEGSFDLNTTVANTSIIGELIADLDAPNRVEVWDNANQVQVRLYDSSQTLAPGNDLAVLNGANPLAVLTPSGEWEILQYVNSSMTSAETYTLSRLLRGQLGTEKYIGDPTPAGSRIFVANQGTYGYLEGSNSRLNIPRDYRYGPRGVNINDERFQQIEITPRGVALRPYAPVHLKQFRDPISGDIELTWLRRTRFSGDNWQFTDVPLNEDQEEYEIDIRDGITVLRTVLVGGVNTYTYSLADQVTDFGSGQMSVDWTVYQMSALYGRGSPGVSLI